MKITEIPRDDVSAAMKFLAELGRKPTPDEAQMLLMLQSNPKALIEAFKRQTHA